MKKSLVIIVVVVLVLGAAFVFIDESLTPETKAWLDAPLTLPDNTRGRALLKEFEEIIAGEKRSLSNQRPRPSDEVVQACATMSQTCFELLVSQSVERRRYLPQDPRYYEKFSAILDESVLFTHQSQVFSVAWQNLIVAPRYVFLNSLVEQGSVDPLLLARSLEFSRLMMRDAPNLLEKTIFLPMFGNSIAAANMAMGLWHLTVEEVLVNTDLDRLFVGFDDERSFSNVMTGELRFAAYYFDHDA